MFERFSDDAVRVILRSMEESRKFGQDFVDTEMILLGLVADEAGPVAHSLKRKGAIYNVVRAEVRKYVGESLPHVNAEIPFAPRCKRLLELAWNESKCSSPQIIDTGHLLLGLIAEAQESLNDPQGSKGTALRILETLYIDLQTLRNDVLLEMDPQMLSSPPRASNPQVSSEVASLLPQNAPIMLHAHAEATRFGHNFIGTEQILIAILAQGQGIAAESLQSLGVNLDRVRFEVESIIGRGSGFISREISLTPRAKRTFELARDESRRLGDSYIGSEHVLLGLIRENEGVAIRVLNRMLVETDILRKVLLKKMGKSN